MAIVGFSQGTMMSLYTIPRRKKTCAGIAGYSGMMPAIETFGTECASKPPVILMHGKNDPIVPVEATEKAFEILQENEFKAEKHLYPNLEHGISMDGLNDGLKFLKTVFS